VYILAYTSVPTENMPTLPKTDPALHLLIPDFLIYLAQYPANYAIPSTLFAPPTDHKPPSDDNESADSPRAQGGISSIRTRPDIRVDFLSVTRSEGEITILYSIPYAHASSSSGDGSAVGEGINGTSDGAALEEKQKAALQMLKLDEPDEGDGPYAAIRVQGPLDLSESA
jgi:hypothetical protein